MKKKKESFRQNWKLESKNSMTGQEFFEKVTRNPRYKRLYENNIHFNTQMQYLKSKPKVLTSTLLGSIAYLSILLMYQDLEKIRESDNEIGV